MGYREQSIRKAGSDLKPRQCHHGHASLIILNLPLPKFDGGIGEDQGDVALIMQRTGAGVDDELARLLFHAGDRGIVPEIDCLIEQQVQGRVRDRGVVHRVELGILDIDAAAGGHDQDRAGRIIEKSQPPRLDRKSVV